MEKELEQAFTGLCESARKNETRTLPDLFDSPEAMDEMELPSLRHFLAQNEVSLSRVEFMESAPGAAGDTDLARVFYSYRHSKLKKEMEPVSTEYTWFLFRKTEGGAWKAASKGAYLRRLAETRRWRRIEGERIVHHFDYSIKKSMDSIHAGCAQEEYARLLEFLGETGRASPLDYFVYNDEKSLPELGLEAGASGTRWIFSAQPCDLFQMTCQVLKAVNGRLPRFPLFGFAAYYTQFVAGGRYPIFPFSAEELPKKAAEAIKEIPPAAIGQLTSNVEFDRWAQMVSYFVHVSRKPFSAQFFLLLYASSFVKFLFESEEIGATPGERKEKILKVLKRGDGENFESIFKETAGLKLRKAEKSWLKALAKGRG